MYDFLVFKLNNGLRFGTKTLVRDGRLETFGEIFKNG